MSKRDFAITAIAVGFAVLTNLYVQGLGPVARTIVFLSALTLVVVGFLTLVAIQDELPLWLRSRRWAKREIKRMIEDPSHRLHRPYWRRQKGYEGISDVEHEYAVAFMASLQQQAQGKGWHRRQPRQ
jgi:hypothetical protein